MPNYGLKGTCFMKLVVSDLDGTILMRREREIGREAANAIDYVLESGNAFAVASGRSYGELKRLFERWEDRIYFIASDGAIGIYREKTLFEHPISTFTSTVFAAHGKYMTFLKGADVSLLRAHLSHYHNHVMTVSDFSEIDAPVYKITDFSRDGKGELSEVYRSRDMAEYVSPGVNKGTALSELCSHLNLDLSETVAFGDGENDLEMFAAAGLSVAALSAPPNIKKRADKTAAFKTDELKRLI